MRGGSELRVDKSEEITGQRIAVGFSFLLKPFISQFLYAVSNGVFICLKLACRKKYIPLLYNELFLFS